MDKDKIIGIVLLVLGILMLLNFISIPFIEIILGLGALVVGILMFMGKIRGETWMAILLVALGVIILATPYLNFLTGAISTIIDVVVGIILVILGVMRLK